MKFRLVAFLFVIICGGIAYQQYAEYALQRDGLLRLTEESKRSAYLIEKAMYEESALRQQLADARAIHHALREVLPESIEADAFEKRLRSLAAKYRVKILALKPAIYSRPQYTQANLSLTIESSSTSTSRLASALKALPRIVKWIPGSKIDKKYTYVTIAIFAVEAERYEPPSFPQCLDMPGGVWLPHLRHRLEELHAAYTSHCSYITNYGEIYRESRRLHYLQGEIARLRVIRDELKHFSLSSAEASRRS